MTDADHIEMLDKIRGLQGMVLLSAYENDFYNQYLKSWKKIRKSHHALGAKKRTECLWIKPNAIRQLSLI